MEESESGSGSGREWLPYRNSGWQVYELSAILGLAWHCEGKFKLTTVVHVEVIMAREVSVEDKLLGTLSLGVKQHVLAEELIDDNFRRKND